MKIGYYRQQSQELEEDLRVIQYIEGIRLAVLTASGETISAAKMLKRFSSRALTSGPISGICPGESAAACTCWASSWSNPTFSSWTNPPMTWILKP